MTAQTPGSGRAEAIAEGLRGQILNGKYGPGERLPSERELSMRLGVNRSSVREALKKLEQLGMIAIRRGGGARVVPMEEAGLGVLRHALSAKRPDRELVAQWLDVHELVIAGAARFAIERGTEEEFAQAKRLLRRLVSPSTTEEEFVATADRLTELIALASRNVVLRMVRNGLTAAAQRQGDARRKLRASRKALLPIVTDIERAMDQRDPVAAEEGVRRLLRSNRAMVLDLIAGPVVVD
jgi:GntR family transcriptional repressor for pyruvate dehydrogenase complex